MSPDPADLLDLLPVSVARVGPDLRLRSANARLCQLLGRPPERVIGHSCAEWANPEAFGEWVAAVRQVFATGRPAEAQYVARLPDGERLVLTKCVPLAGPDGPEVLAVGVVNDEVRQLRDALALTERRLQAFLDHVPAIAWLRDADQNYLFVNREYCRLQKITEADRVGKHLTEVFPPELAAHLMANDELSLSGPIRTEEKVPDGTGLVRSWLNVKFTVPGSDGRPQYAGIGLDMTAEAEREAERQALRAKLLIAQKAESMGVLAGGVAHDFNNLLSAILGFAGLAKSYAPPGAGPLADCLTQIETAADRAADLCKQMLAYAGGGEGGKRKAVDLSALARETVRLLAAGHLRGVTVTTRLAADLPAVVGDPTQLRQVVLNLLTNAAEATAGRSPRAVTVTTDAADGWVRLTVADTGVGMDTATAARVFEPFFTTKRTGRGLGLAAVDGIVRDHGGSIRLTTAPGEGAAFEVRLPAGSL